MSEQSGIAPPGNLSVKRTSTIATFSSLIETYGVSGHEDLDVQLRNEIAAWREHEKGIDSSNFNGWHSARTLMSRPEPGFRQLATLIGKSALSYVRRFEKDFDPARRELSIVAWANINGKSAFNGPHSHGYFHVSGVYYVSTPKPTSAFSGLLEFISPLATYRPPMKFGAQLLPTRYRIRPAAGDLVLFPAYLEHWVYPNEEDEDRISVAFNVLVQD